MMSAALLCHTWSRDLHAGFHRRFNECQPVTFFVVRREVKSHNCRGKLRKSLRGAGSEVKGNLCQLMCNEGRQEKVAGR